MSRSLPTLNCESRLDGLGIQVGQTRCGSGKKNFHNISDKNNSNTNNNTFANEIFMEPADKLDSNNNNNTNNSNNNNNIFVPGIQ